MGESIIIVPGNDDGAGEAAATQAQEAADVSQQAAGQSVAGAIVSAEGAGSAEQAASQSGEAAEVSTEAAAVSVAGAAKSEATLAGVVELLNTLPDRLSTAINGAKSTAPIDGEQLDPATPVERDSKTTPIERKPDKRPSDTHWYTKKRGGNR